MMRGVLANLERDRPAAALIEALTAFVGSDQRHFKGYTDQHYAYLMALAVTSGKHLNTVIEGTRACPPMRGGLPSKSAVFRRLEHITNQKARDATLPATLAIAAAYAAKRGFTEVELCLDETDLPSSANRRQPGQDRKLTPVGQLTTYSKHGTKLKPKKNSKGERLHRFLDRVLFGVEYLVLVARFPDGAKFPLWMLFVDPIRHPTVTHLTRECLPAIDHFQNKGMHVTFIGDKRWDVQETWLLLNRRITNGTWIIPARVHDGSRRVEGGQKGGGRQRRRAAQGVHTVIDAIEDQWRNAIRVPGTLGKWIAPTTAHLRKNSPRKQHVILRYSTRPENVRLGNTIELWKTAHADAFVVGHECDLHEAIRMLDVYRHRWDGSEEGIRLLKMIRHQASGPAMNVRLTMANAACIAACIGTWLARRNAPQRYVSHAWQRMLLELQRGGGNLLTTP